MNNFCADQYLNAILSTETVLMKGKITKIIGLVIEADGPSINLGELCYIYPQIDAPLLPAEVVGFRHGYLSWDCASELTLGFHLLGD